MRHVAEAKKLLQSGESHEALDVLDNLLGLAPSNHEALRLKAQILDAHGRFDESLTALRDLARFDGISDETLKELEQRTLEEREVTVYSELTPDGRWYFSFPTSQIWISLYGFFGCAFFLVLSPGLLGSDAVSSLPSIIIAFVIFVATPWLALMAVHLYGIKKIYVGMNGLKICTRFKERHLPWDCVDSACIEYDQDIRTGRLHLAIYGRLPPAENSPSAGTGKSPLGMGAEPTLAKRELLVRLNISPKGSVVRARRHFVRSILAHVDVVSYIASQGREPKSVGKALDVDSQSNRSHSSPDQAS